MSQRRRQARLLSLRFTGPPPPRLCGPRPAWPESPPRARPARATTPRRSAGEGRPHFLQLRPQRGCGSPAARLGLSCGAAGGLGSAPGLGRRPEYHRRRPPPAARGRAARWQCGASGQARRLEPEPSGGPRPRPASTCATRAAPREAAQALGARRRADGTRPGPRLRPAPPLRARSRRPPRGCRARAPPCPTHPRPPVPGRAQSESSGLAWPRVAAAAVATRLSHGRLGPQTSAARKGAGNPCPHP